MVKKASILLLILILTACSAKKNKLDSDNTTGNFIINKDSVSIITPYIELKEKSNSSFIEHPEKRKNLTKFTIETLKSEFPNAEYIEIPFLFGDYKTINASLERKLSYKVENAPTELLTDKYKKSIFISMTGYFGDLNRGVIMLFVIDNKNKKWKMIERYKYDYSPLETDKIKNRILKLLKKVD